MNIARELRSHFGKFSHRSYINFDFIDNDGIIKKKVVIELQTLVGSRFDLLKMSDFIRPMDEAYQSCPK